MSRAYVAVGSNVEPFANVPRAIARLSKVGNLAAVSTFYRTAAVGPGPDFVNGVVAVEPREPDTVAFRWQLRAIERDAGRVRTEDPNAPRPVDLDLVAWPGRVDERIPHVDLERYAFVARPLAELDTNVVTRSGRAVGAVARAMPPFEMTPLPLLTTRLRALVRAQGRLHA